MPNYLLCDRFYVRYQFFNLISTCTASSNNKESWFKSKRYVSLVLCVGDCFLNLALCFRNRLRSSASCNCIRERDNKIVVLLRVNRRVL